MNEYYNYIIENSYVWMNKLFFSVFVFVLFYFIAKISFFLINRISRKFDYNRSIVKLIATSVKMTLIIIGLITALGTFGINISALVAGLGLTGFAIGFALKDTISNLLSGILIILYKPFKIGDNIKVAGFEGVVESIDLRYTKLNDNNQKVIIPNSKMFAEPIVVEKENNS